MRRPTDPQDITTKDNGRPHQISLSLSGRNNLSVLCRCTEDETTKLAELALANGRILDVYRKHLKDAATR
jgi:hypothetical protein